MNLPPARDRRLPGVWLTVILAAALALRLALAPAYARLPDGYLDEWFWTSWMFAIHDHGVLNVFRTTEANYVGYQWVLWLLSLVYEAIGGAYRAGDVRLHLLVKAPSIAADLALIVVAYHATCALAAGEAGDRPSPEAHPGITRPQQLGLLAAAIVAVQPAIVYDSAVWAQTDAAIGVAMLCSLLLLARGHTTAAWVVWALGMSVKPQAVVLLPVLGLATLQVHGIRPLLRGGGAAFATFGLILTPWMLHGDTLRLTAAYGALFGSDYGRLSVSAWNSWWFVDQIATLRPNDAVAVAPFATYRLLGLALSAFAGVLAAGYASAHRDLRGLLIAGAYLAFAFYMLPMSIHERYLFPVLALLLPVALVDRRWMWVYAPVSLTLFTNMFVIAPPVEAWSGRWVDAPIIPLVAGANVAMFAAFTAMVARGAADSLPAAASFVRHSYPFSRIGVHRSSAPEPAVRKAA